MTLGDGAEMGLGLGQGWARPLEPLRDGSWAATEWPQASGYPGQVQVGQGCLSAPEWVPPQG